MYLSSLTFFVITMSIRNDFLQVKATLFTVVAATCVQGSAWGPTTFLTIPNWCYTCQCLGNNLSFCRAHIPLGQGAVVCRNALGPGGSTVPPVTTARPTVITVVPPIPITTVVPPIPIITVVPPIPVTTVVPPIPIITVVPPIPIITVVPPIPIITVVPPIPITTAVPPIPITTAVPPIPIITPIPITTAPPPVTTTRPATTVVTPSPIGR